MNLPLPVQAYFGADQNNDGLALVQTFAIDAVVTDDGQSHAGHKAIEAWWRQTKARTPYRNELLDASEMGDTTEVRAQAIGQFPGSPVKLVFAFQLKGHQILRLDIRA